MHSEAAMTNYAHHGRDAAQDAQLRNDGSRALGVIFGGEFLTRVQPMHEAKQELKR